MELVRGIKITDYCDQANLSTKERLDLFIKVCQAIQHAHQKGIIHRDIKPSNILVTLHDGVPVPKVIDFGIAKATEGRLTDNTVYTQLHQFIGTPAYMSPEQAEMSGLDIDTRSDIYSLGVLLYELLTGSTPFDAKELMASGIDAMRKTIREKEPQRPSTKLSQTLVAASVSSLKSSATGKPTTEEEVSADSRSRFPLSVLRPSQEHAGPLFDEPGERGRGIEGHQIQRDAERVLQNGRQLEELPTGHPRAGQVQIARGRRVFHRTAKEEQPLCPELAGHEDRLRQQLLQIAHDFEAATSARSRQWQVFKPPPLSAMNPNREGLLFQLAPRSQSRGGPEVAKHGRGMGISSGGVGTRAKSAFVPLRWFS